MNDLRASIDACLRLQLPRAETATGLAEIVRVHGGFRWVGLYDVLETHICALGWTGRNPPAYPSFPVHAGLNGAAVAAKAPIIVQDVSQDARYLTTFSVTRAEAIFPVLSDNCGIVLGTIDVESDHVDAFQAADIALLEECARLLRPLWTRCGAVGTHSES